MPEKKIRFALLAQLYRVILLFFFKAQELLSRLLENSDWKLMKLSEAMQSSRVVQRHRGAIAAPDTEGQPCTLQRKCHVTNRCLGLLAAMGH